MSFFGWHISFRRLYFRSSRVEYQIRLWHRVKYHRPKVTISGIGIGVISDGVTEVLGEDTNITTNIEEEK